MITKVCQRSAKLMPLKFKKIAELGLIAVIQVEAKYFSTIEFSLSHYKL